MKKKGLVKAGAPPQHLKSIGEVIAVPHFLFCSTPSSFSIQEVVGAEVDKEIALGTLSQVLEGLGLALLKCYKTIQHKNTTTLLEQTQSANKLFESVILTSMLPQCHKHDVCLGHIFA